MQQLTARKTNGFDTKWEAVSAFLHDDHLHCKCNKKLWRHLEKKMNMKSNFDIRLVCSYDTKLVSFPLMAIQLELQTKKVVNKFGHCTKAPNRGNSLVFCGFTQWGPKLSRSHIQILTEIQIPVVPLFFSTEKVIWRTNF